MAVAQSNAKRKLQKKKAERMDERAKERAEAVQAQLEKWFNDFDVNKNNRLERHELQELLSFLYPGRPPSEQMMDTLCLKASEVRTTKLTLPGQVDASIPWHDVRATVIRYHDYCKEQAYLDRVFATFDIDASDNLDVSEVPRLLKAAAPQGIVPDSSDVAYVMGQADANSDGVISRWEILPLIARWRVLIVEERLVPGNPPGPLEKGLRSLLVMIGCGCAAVLEEEETKDLFSQRELKMSSGSTKQLVQLQVGSSREPAKLTEPYQRPDALAGRGSISDLNALDLSA